MNPAENEKDRSFRAFLKMVWDHPVEIRYFGETFAWIALGCVISWFVFPDSWVAHPTDFRAFWIIIPFGLWALLRGVYILWRDDS